MILVEDIIKNSIAEELDIKKGDEVISINGVKPKDIIEYIESKKSIAMVIFEKLAWMMRDRNI